MKPSTPKTELPPSTQLRTVVLGGAQRKDEMTEQKRGAWVISLMFLLLFGWRPGSIPAAEALPQPGTDDPLSKWTTVEAHDNGIPVYAFGYTYVYGVSPDFQPGVVLQEGNEAAAKKVHPKKSWEIKNNLFGSTPAREPRTAAYDDQPFLGVHLIDGDVLSCWTSRGQNQPDFEPAWIRIDLPIEAVVSRVVLVGHPTGMGEDPTGQSVKVGQSFPRKLEIRLSRDAWHWDTVYKNDNYTPQDGGGRNEIAFSPRWAKQIWIVGSDLRMTYYPHFGHAFSVAGAEVLDRDGNNLALISRGAGVQVASTQTGYLMDRFTQDMLWPVQYDLGFKWTRLGYDLDYFKWAYVEREKGKYHVDERAEAVLTEAVKNGIEVVMCLDKGNWLYTPTPKKFDRTRDLDAVTGANHPPEKVVDYAPHLEGYLNYVRFMVRHLKDRVKYFEIWNEWLPYTSEGAKNYARLLRPAIKVIREEYPQAKIIPASPGWLVGDDFGWFKALGEEGLLSQVEVIGFHPFYDPPASDPNLVSFPSAFRRFKKMMEGYGFKGEYAATEWTFAAPYPSPDLDKIEVHSEIQKAIYAARLSITFAHLGIVNFWNETFRTMQTEWSIGLLRNGFSNEVICSPQPEAVYYMLRTLSTALEDVKGAELPVTFSDKRREVEHYGFVRSHGEKLLAFWLPGIAEVRGRKPASMTTDVVIKGAKGEGATIIDVLNGTEKPLKVEATSEGIVLRKIRVQSWPLIIRLPKSE